ncbi:MAG: imidazole glycerol phosphate synthase subunit HisF [Peptococcales bacterium]|jgi:cyclase
MKIKRIIPCLDIKAGRVVKGVSFENLKDAGDPLELAKYYEKAGADELVLLDISASMEGRSILLKLVHEMAEVVTIPFTVGGGINSIEDIKKVLEAGANKASLNTSAVSEPSLMAAAARLFGKEHIVAAIDAKFNKDLDIWEVYTHGGTQNTRLNVIDWAGEVEKRGAGEILLTSMDCDGHQGGFDLKLTENVCKSVSIPVIASGGAGSKEDFADVFSKGCADAGLAASIFHYQETSIIEIKRYLTQRGIPVQWEN